MKRRLVIDDTEDWPPAAKRLRVDLMEAVQVRPCDEVPLGLVADVWTGHIVPALVADDYACRTLVMLRRTCRWLAHRVVAPNITRCPKNEPDHTCPWVRLYAAECRAFLRAGHLGGLAWCITAGKLCRTRWVSTQRDIMHACIQQKNTEAYYRVHRAWRATTTHETLILAVQSGHSALVLDCFEHLVGWTSYSALLNHALAYEQWAVFPVIARRVARNAETQTCLTQLDPAFFKALVSFAALSPLALAAAVDLQNILLRHVKLHGPRYKAIRPALLDFARFINRHAVTL